MENEEVVIYDLEAVELPSSSPTIIVLPGLKLSSTPVTDHRGEGEYYIQPAAMATCLVAGLYWDLMNMESEIKSPIVISGGRTSATQKSEAIEMYSFMRQHFPHIPESSYYLDELAMSTVQNAENVAAIVKRLVENGMATRNAIVEVITREDQKPRAENIFATYFWQNHQYEGLPFLVNALSDVQLARYLCDHIERLESDGGSIIHEGFNALANQYRELAIEQKKERMFWPGIPEKFMTQMDLLGLGGIVSSVGAWSRRS